MATYRGDLWMVGEPASRVEAEIRIEGDRVAIAARGQTLGEWDRKNLSVRSAADGYHITVDGEEMVFASQTPGVLQALVVLQTLAQSDEGKPDVGSRIREAAHTRPAPATRPTPSHGDTINGTLLLVGAGAVVLGSFLPWLSASAAFIGSVSRSGVEGGGDGLFTAIGGIVLLVLGLELVTRGRVRRIPVLISAAVVAVIVVVDWSDVAGRVSDLTSGDSLVIASVGAGLYVVALGVLVSVVAAFRGNTAKQIQRQVAGN